MNTEILNSIMSLLPVIVILLAMVVFSVILFKDEIFAGDKWWTFICPLILKKEDYRGTRIAIGVVFIAATVIVGNVMQAGAITIILSIWILNWIIYLFFHALVVIIGFAAGMKKTAWTILFLMPFLSLMSSVLCSNIQSFKYISFIYLAHILLAAVTLIGTYYLMYNVAKSKSRAFENASSAASVETIIAELYLILIQILNFEVMLEFLKMAGVTIVADSDGNIITKATDFLYFVIMTYTTVGYGDLHPCSDAGKFLSCLISLTGFVTSACVIGLLAGNMQGNINGNKEEKDIDTASECCDK